MKQLEKEQLTEYIKHGIAIVNELYCLETVFYDFETVCDRNKPLWKEKDLPEKPTPQSYGDTRKWGWFWLFWAIICLAIGIGYSVISSIILGSFFVILHIYLLKKIKEIAASNDNAIKHYAEQRQKVIEDNKRIKEEYEKKHELWRKSKIKGIEYIQDKLEEIQKVSEDYFAIDVIFPKYRNLVALSSFYEYLSSGRCEELTGPNGAYNLYEAESRQNIIITKLDTIISNLEQIRRNQYILYEELKKSTAILSQISSDLSIVRDLTFDLTEIASLNLYYNSVTAANTSALMFLETIR